MWSSARLAWSALVASAFLAAPVGAQAKGDSMLVYQREVFEYSREDRQDPFRSLLKSSELGIRVEDLTLRGVIHQPNGGRSVAVLSRSGSARPLRARVGDRMGGIRIVSIRPRSVDVVIEELGVARRETLELKPAPAPEKGGSS